MVIYYIVVANFFLKMGVFMCIPVYIQIKPHEKIEKNPMGVYVYTCLHPNKRKI